MVCVARDDDVCCVVQGGLLMGYLYWRTRSLVPGILVHTYSTLWAFPWMG